MHCLVRSLFVNTHNLEHDDTQIYCVVLNVLQCMYFILHPNKIGQNQYIHGTRHTAMQYITMIHRWPYTWYNIKVYSMYSYILTKMAETAANMIVAISVWSFFFTYWPGWHLYLLLPTPVLYMIVFPIRTAQYHLGSMNSATPLCCWPIWTNHISIRLTPSITGFALFICGSFL